jgi:SAM-dependent methyltransferase
MSKNTHAGFAWWSAITILVSAFLLFQVQPIISKMILPWFGGGPAVWTACMLFFQVLLLAGYAYAHALSRLPRTSWQTLFHIVFLLAAAAMLPITPAASWKPADGSQPTWRILMLLSANVGLPYFLLASTSPLIQAWFSRVCVGRRPYRLYALSNVGSLGALLTYPFLFEPWLTTNRQGQIWSQLFAVFACLCGGLAVAAYLATKRDDPSDPAEDGGGIVPSYAESLPSPTRRLAWLFLPALASVMLLAVTNHLCQDVAVVPFFWVVPLSLYLLSFIICFDREFWYRRRIFAVLTTVALFALCVILLERDVKWLLDRSNWKIDVTWPLKVKWAFDVKWLPKFDASVVFDQMDNLAVEAGVYLVVLFLICMVCHGELVRLKPSSERLTEFYLMVGAGGALGGILVGLVCPQVFSSYVEMHIGLVAAFLLAMAVFWDAMWETWLLRRFWRKLLVFAFGFLLLLVVVRGQFVSVQSDALLTLRNFYGVLSIKEHYQDDPDSHIRELLNGRILHGSQFQDLLKRRVPTTYYNEESGIGLTVTQLRKAQPLRIAVVGLGTGSIAAYGRKGDFVCFYEINPNVPRVAREYFTYLEDSPARIDIRQGDARLTLERETPQQYDVIALDAFSGDAIPVHLLTKEAFELYLRHLAPTGVLAVHISNRHLDLKPVVGGIAATLNVPVREVSTEDDGLVGEAASDWVLLTRNESFLGDPAIREAAEEVQGKYKPVRLWTDDYSNLFQILKLD